MTIVLFDKLTFVDRLKRAGIPDDHARAHAEATDEALREGMATKSDIADVRAEIAAVRTEIAGIRTDLDYKLQIAVRDITIRLGGMMVVLFAALVASLKFFGH